MRQTLLLCVAGGTLDLVIVVVQADHIAAGKLDDLTSGSSNTAADVKDAHTLPESHHMGKIVFVAGNGLEERLSVGKAAEME